MKKETETIRREFHRSAEARYIHRLHGVLLVLLGQSTVNAGKLLGDPQRTVAHWVALWKKGGLSALKDAEKSGRPGALTTEQKQDLEDILAHPPKKVGIDADTWTNALVQELLEKRYYISLSTRQCSRLLRELT